MYISGAANIINVIGNIIGVFVLRMGVAGVAYPSLISRTISAVAITIYCFKNKTAVKYKMCNIFIWDSSLLKKVLGIAIPNGVENGVHQLIKVALSSLIALFGTYQIAANGVAQSIWSLSALMGLTMAPVFTTVIGQCMGAGDIKSAEHYFKKLSKITLILSLSWNALVFAATPLFMHFFALSAETKKLVIILVLLHNVVNGAVFPFAGPLGSGLRAAGDVRFTMITSVMLTIFARLIFSYIFGLYLNLGVIGVAFGMNIDVIIRGIMFIHRYKSRKWTSFKLV